MTIPSLLFLGLAVAMLSASCSMPGSTVMGELQQGMSRDQVSSIMQSHGMKPDDSRKRPAGGWPIHGRDPFAAGSKAGLFERESGQRVEWAEVYQISGERGASVINLHYDGSGRLLD